MASEVNKLESDFVAAETRMTREVQERNMDRETKALQDMSEMHMQEKRKIFETYLPDSLMKDIYADLADREQEDMDLYQKELAALKAQKMQEMKDDERRYQAELAEQHQKLKKLSAEEAAVAKKEMALSRRQQNQQRQDKAIVNSQDAI